MRTPRKLIQICLLSAGLLHAFTIGAQPVIKVAGGAYHTLFLKSDGSLWGMGENDDGALGDGTYNNTNRPEQIVASNVTDIAAGYYHSLFLKSDGSLWTMGDNQVGQLGDSTYITTNVPEMIVASNVTAIAAGWNHSLFLKSDGSLWAVGWEYYGQLGDGTFGNSATLYGTNVPEQIVASNVTAIAAGEGHSLFLKSDGSLWGMGWNENGQLGDGTYTTTFPYGIDLPEQIVASNVTAIAGGSFHSLFLKSDGSLWAMGGNTYGQLGDGTTDNGNYETNRPEQIVASGVTAIAAGWDHSLFLKSDGSLWAMGNNEYGQLGDGTTNEDNHNLSTNQPEEIVANGVTAIGAGAYHSLFLKSDGSLWAMGRDDYGQLGDGTYSTNVRTFPYLGTNQPEQIVAGPPGYNQIVVQLLSGGNVSLSFLGMAGTNYELDWSASLSPANWVPQATNPAGAGGVLVFTNTPDATTNNFWRIRSVP